MSSPAFISCAIALHLRIRVNPEKRDVFLEFLRQARPYYEEPGGIHMRLLQDTEDENALIEIFEYETVEAYQRDEQRVASDSKMKAFLDVWRSLIEGPPKVEICVDLTETELVDETEEDASSATEQE